MKPFFLLLVASAMSSTVAMGQCHLDHYSVAGGSLLRYPPLAQAALISGEVVVSFDVDTQGSPINVHALSGHALLADSTADMVKTWRLQSADQKVTSVKNCRVVFNYSILTPPKDPGCNKPVQPQILQVMFRGASRVEVGASPRFIHFCDSFSPDSAQSRR